MRPLGPRQPELATCHLAWPPLLYFKTTGNGLGRSVARLSLRKPKYGLWEVFKGLPTAGTRGWQLRPFSSACAYTKVKIGKGDCSPHDCVSLTLCLVVVVGDKTSWPLKEARRFLNPRARKIIRESLEKFNEQATFRHFPDFAIFNWVCANLLPNYKFLKMKGVQPNCCQAP